MGLFSTPRGRLIIFFIILMILTCSPIWWVDYFVNQDGSGHLHTASLMGKLLAGDASTAEFYQFNSISVPNSSGHWILLLLLQVFSAFTVTKIFVTLSYALFVAGAGWLRLQIAGQDGVKTSLLIGAAMGFNWLWLVGFYNFTIGVIGLMFTLGYFFRRRERFGAVDTIILSLLLTLAYFSHIVSFLVLTGSIFVVILFAPGVRRAKTIMLTLVALLPVVPFALRFKSLSEGGGGFSAPVWRSLDDPYSVASWVHQMRVADPFIIISRKAIPFFAETSSVFAIFTPTLWLFIAFSSLAIASIYYYRSNPESFKANFVFLLLAIGALGLAILGPDDFNQTNGGVLRERFFICGLLFCIPLFRTGTFVRLKRIAQVCLLFIIAFQTLAVWEYALDSDKKAKIFMAAADLLRQSPSSASITLEENSLRFHANPIAQLNCYNGIGTNNIVWDNYEFGHYLFPLIARKIDDQQLIFNFTRGQYIALDDPDDGFGTFDVKLGRIKSSLEAYNDKIETIALWGRDPRVEAMLNKWFESVPYFENEKLRLFRHK